MSVIQVIPAIDLKGGKCVRLRQGRAEDSTIYSEDPVSMALHWVKEGGEYLHVVDLDGAFNGRPMHRDLIEQIAKSITIPVEVGGGLRTDEDIESLLRAGVARVVLGTRAWAEPAELQRLVKRFGAALVVGIDARDGRVQIKGWTETTSQTAVDLARRAEAMGVKTLIYTDTSTDGMLKGPNVKAVDELCGAVGCQVIASGGISAAEDMLALRMIGRSNLCGAIVGKALYEGRVTIEALKKSSR